MSDLKKKKSSKEPIYKTERIRNVENNLMVK